MRKVHTAPVDGQHVLLHVELHFLELDQQRPHYLSREEVSHWRPDLTARK